MRRTTGSSKPMTSLALAALVGFGGCTSGGDDDDSSGFPDPPSLEDLEVEANPANVLSCSVRWRTSEAGTSRVEFGEGGDLSFFVEDAGVQEEHEVLVFGMAPATAYRIEAVTVLPGGEELRSEPVEFVSGELPFTAATLEVTEHREDLMQPGWTAMNMHVGAVWARQIAVIVDMEGRVVWYHSPSEVATFGDLEVTLVDGDRVLMGGSMASGISPVEVDMAGDVAWSGPPQPDIMLTTGSYHHTFQKRSDGNYLTLLYDFDEGLLRDVIAEMDPAGETVWTWEAADHIPAASVEHIHCNMTQVVGDFAYIHAHQLACLYKIDRETGEIVWKLGRDRDFGVVGDHADPWFDFAHGPEILGNGDLLLYDNGGTLERPFSRVMQYAIDEEEMTVEPVWEYPGDLAEDEWFTIAWGDADLLDNGNRLIVAGSMVLNDSQSRVFEVTEDGTMAWELYFSGPDGEAAGAYMAQRIPMLVGVL